jgi:hypothetical protein
MKKPAARAFSRIDVRLLRLEGIYRATNLGVYG